MVSAQNSRYKDINNTTNMWIQHWCITFDFEFEWLFFKQWKHGHQILMSACSCKKPNEMLLYCLSVTIIVFCMNKHKNIATFGRWNLTFRFWAIIDREIIDMICQFSRFHYFSFQVVVWWLHYEAWSVHAVKTSISYWIKIR